MAKVDHAAEIVTLRTALAEKTAKFDTLTDSVKVLEDNTIVIEPDQRKDANALVEEMKTLNTLIAGHEVSMGQRRYEAQPDGQGGAAGRQDAHVDQYGVPSYKTLGEMFTGSDQYKALRERPDMVRSARFTLDAHDPEAGPQEKALRHLFTPHERKDVFTAGGGNFTGPAFGTRQDSGIVPRQHRTARVRDLFPSDTTTSNLIEYIRVSGFTNNAAPVRERYAADGVSAPIGDNTDVFGLKPSSDLAFSPQTAPIRTIAHWIRASRTVLDDEPRLQAIINGEMLYGLQLSEDSEILTGDGTGEHVLGLLNTSGIQSQVQAGGPGAPTEKMSATTRKAITKVILAFYESTGLVVNPLDFESLELETNDFGGYMLVQNVQVGLQKLIWRLPVVETPVIPQGTGLVGSFGISAKVWDRMQGSVIVSTEDRDNVVRNAVTILAEERLGLEVTRPESFVKITYYGEP
jgi:HK97 family phage major capsid protein